MICARKRTFRILSDPNAEVIPRYNLLHLRGGLTGMTLPEPPELLVDSSAYLIRSATPLKAAHVLVAAQTLSEWPKLNSLAATLGYDNKNDSDIP